MPAKDKIEDVKKALAECIKVGSVSEVAKKYKVHSTALRYHLRKDKKAWAAYRVKVKGVRAAKKAQKKTAKKAA